MSARALVYIRIILYSLWALSGAWNTAMAGVKWSTMGWEECSCLIFGVFQTWSGTMMAFFDKSLWRYDEEKRQNGKTPQPAQPAAHP